jgi:hypothetical protein
MVNICVGHTWNGGQKLYSLQQLAPSQTASATLDTTNKHTDNQLLGQIRPSFCQNAYEEVGAEELQFVIYRAA